MPDQHIEELSMFKRLIVALLALFAAAAFAAVDVNKATPAELDGVKGIGPAIAAKIVDERKKGSFKDWNDFVGRVSGIGEKSAAKLSADGLTVNGQAFSGAAPAAPAAKAKADAKPAAAAATTAAPAAAAKADAKPAAAPAAADKASMSKADAKAAAKAEKAEKAAAKKAEKAAAKADAASAAKK
jgi:competence protein ComEA